MQGFGFACVLGLLSSGNVGAQDIFTITSGPTITTSVDPGPETGDVAGDIDINKDGTVDGTWSLSLTASGTAGNNKPLDMTTFDALEGDFVSILTSTSRKWDMDATFTINASVPGVTFQPTLRGSMTYPNVVGNQFQNNFSGYGFNWSNGTGGTTATVLDPRSQLNVPSGTANGFSFAQSGSAGTAFTFTRSGTAAPESCDKNGSWANACIAWQIATPAGFSTLDVTGAGGRAKEGFGFGILSKTDIKVEKAADQAAVGVGQAGSFTIAITNDGVVGDSAVVDLSWSDVLPAGLDLTSASFTIARNNSSFASTSDADFATLLDVNTTTNTVSFDGVTLQLGDVIEIVVNFTPDGSVTGDITNTAGIIGMVQTDTDSSNDTASAIVTAVGLGPASPDVALAVCQAPNFAGVVPDGVEDLAFPRGYWAASYYEGRDSVPGSSATTSANGTGGAGSKIFHGEAFFGVGENPVTIEGDGTSDSYGRWAQDQNPTSVGLPHPSYVGTTWDNAPSTTRHYQVDHRRKIDVPGVLTFGYDPATEVLDDTLEIFINGTRIYAHWPPSMGAAPFTRPGAGGVSGNTGFTIPVAANDEVLVRFQNHGWIGGYAFHLDVAGHDCSDTPTTGTSYGTASHIEHAASAHLLGITNDDDTTDISSANADGDGAEDDGVTIPTLNAGDTGTVTIPVGDITAASSGTVNLYGWIDFDGDNAFEAGEFASTTVTNGTPDGPLTFSSYGTTRSAGTTFARFRITSDTLINAQFATAASDGEVEDYAVTVDGPAAPIFSAGCVAASMVNGGFEDFAVAPGANTIQPESNIPGWSTDATDNNIELWGTGHNGVSSIEGGVYAELNAYQVAALTQDIGTALVGDTVEWSYWHRGRAGTDVMTFGVGVDGGEATALQTATTDNTAWVNYTGSATVPAGDLRFEFRSVSSAGGNQAVGNLFDNFHFAICPADRDYTDAPTTGTNYGEANHVVTSGLQLGASISQELTGYDSPNADADVDDGVTLPALAQGMSAVIPVNVAGSGGFLQAWIDWDGSGTFDSPVEQIAMDWQDTDGDGFIMIPVTVPNWATSNQTFARFRWSTDFNLGSTGPASDGEVEDYAVTFGALGTGGTVLLGQVFIDTGTGGGMAHDGAVNGVETSGQYASISIIETGAGTEIAAASVNPDGTWQATLPDGFTPPITVVATPANGFLTISEAVGTAPVGTNTSTHDGRLAFTPATDTTYSGIDFGLVPEPTLTADRNADIAAGQIVSLPHVYTATSAGLVSFTLIDQNASPAGAFSQVILGDADCDGVGDSVYSAPVSVVMGQPVCLTVRTQASSGISDSASMSYALTALTTFTGTALTHDLRNDDRLGGSTTNAVSLEKLVRNITSGATEGRSNAGRPNDKLEYRLILTNTSGQPATDVTVTDTTPAYTTLSGPVTTPVVVVPGVTCSLVAPSGAANAAGYAGALAWTCPGTFPAGQQGDLTFQVRIQP